MTVVCALPVSAHLSLSTKKLLCTRVRVCVCVCVCVCVRACVRARVMHGG